jgi:hypothetical protein
VDDAVRRFQRGADDAAAFEAEILAGADRRIDGDLRLRNRIDEPA